MTMRIEPLYSYTDFIYTSAHGEMGDGLAISWEDDWP